MKVCYTLICILFLTALQDGETVKTFSGKEGGNITVRCEFKNSGSRRFLCKETCKGGKILINTNEDIFQSGRYSIRYEEREIILNNYLHVSITKLEKSDSGWYWCGLYDHWIKFWKDPQYVDFYLSVTEDSSEPKWTLGPFIKSTFLPVASTTTTTTTQSLSSSPSPSSSATSRVSEKPAAASGLLLYVGLILSILIIMLAAALLIFFKRKSFRQQRGPEETEGSNFPEAKDGAVEYSELKLMNDATSSPSSAPCGQADNVTYSELKGIHRHQPAAASLITHRSLRPHAPLILCCPLLSISSSFNHLRTKVDSGNFYIIIVWNININSKLQIIVFFLLQ
ncbi:CMRF35-like molecule 1 [Cyprinodon tularosa]|uniref:CMRF35-like molecule 1 n=1 Tax=Cyprinodon tularosa TaxID=77115 RepID=UPI0018E274DC|nr:CMRF35-like molecule 1 [Cyprinodon tularosa]